MHLVDGKKWFSHVFQVDNIRVENISGTNLENEKDVFNISVFLWNIS